MEATLAVVTTDVVIVSYVTITVSVAGSNDGLADGAALMLGDALGRADTLGREDGNTLGAEVGKLL